MMDEDLTTSPDLPGPNIDKIECENRPVEEMDFPCSSSEGVSTESLSTTTISNSLNCVDQLKELLRLPRFASSKSLENTVEDEVETSLYASFGNSCIDEMASSDEHKTEENVSEEMKIINAPLESNRFEIEETPNLIEILSSDKPENIDSDEDNTIEMKNVESSAGTGLEETENLSDEIQSSDKINNVDNQENFEVEKMVNGTENEDEMSSSNVQEEIVMQKKIIESESEKSEAEGMPDSSVGKSEKSQEEIGRCVDFIKRDMLKLILKTSKKKYRIRECQIHLTPVEEDGDEDNILVIKKDQIQCSAEDIYDFVRNGYDSYNFKLTKELTTETDIEYVAVESPPGSTTKSTSKSNSTIVVQQDNVCSLKETSNQDNGESPTHKGVPPGVAVASSAMDTNCKMVLQSLPPYLHKSIVESIRSFSKTDPNSKVPEYIPVQTIIPFKETPSSCENNGFIVVTTGVVQRTEPIYYLRKDTTLHDVFGGNVFSIVSHSLPPSLPKYGTPLKVPGVVVAPSTTPGTVATLLMTPAAAQLLQMTPAARASFQASSGSFALAQVSPGGVASPRVSLEDAALSPGATASPQVPLGTVASPQVSPGGVATQQVSPAYKSTSDETSPVIRKRGRPFGKAHKRQYLSSFRDEYVGGSTPESIKEWKSLQIDKDDEYQRKENGEHHCSCCKKNVISHNEIVSSPSKEVKIIREVKTVNTMVDCDDCGKSYKEGTIHKCVKKKVVKIEEKLLTCSECGRTFSRKAHLNNHMRTHKGYISMTVKCEICKERFKKGNEILKHREEFHPETLSTCDICNKNFQSQRQLDQHKKIHRIKYEDDVASVVRCVYCNGSFEVRHYESVHVQECSNNPRNNSSRTDGTVIVRMAKSVAVRSRPFTDGSVSSGDEDHYQHVEILDEHLSTIGYYSDDLELDIKPQLKRKRNGMHSQSESDREFDLEPPSKQIKLKGTAFRSIKSENNDTDTDILSDGEENGRNYINVEEMMNDKFSSA